jgi:Zn-dependent protease with chaperone function/Zn-finger nucleic acid-binding protein
LAEGQLKPGPRRTIFEVEREKRWRMWLLFGLLLALAFVSAWVGCFIVTVILYLMVPEPAVVSWLFTLSGVAAVLGAALAFSLVYWGLAQIGARGRLLRAMHCRPLDAGDRYHERLANIVEEMRIATGAPRIDCVTVRTVGLNAFAFSDLHGAGVIGVTEGALARLSRQQLQAVVAHEFAHILSGNYVTSTVSCLLFGIYSSLAEQIDDATDATTDADGGSPLAIMLPLRGWLWVMQVAASVVNAAISRQREWQADLAAVRFTRDPLALAEALRVVSRHPGGAGYIPEGLGPLCIRATGSLGWPNVAWRDTHPPLEARIRALLGIADVAPREFERQAAEAGEDFERREHWAAAPAARRQPAPAPDTAHGATAHGATPHGTAASGTVGAAQEAPPLAGAALAFPASSSSSPVSPSTVAVAAGMACPACGTGLVRAPYEGIDIIACDRCGGRLVSSAQVGKLLARREAGFTEEQHRVADLVSASGDHLRRAAVLARGRSGLALVACPRCTAPMMRRHYSYEYAVEIDHCVRCDLLWFERDELEALQILVERQTG